jgi:hypothetical protein
LAGQAGLFARGIDRRHASKCSRDASASSSSLPKSSGVAGHDEGRRAWGRIASLIETAKINNVEPFTYLKTTFEAIAVGHPQSRIDDQLPWNFTPSG